MSIINVDSISDAAGTGSPSFPNGISGNGSAMTNLTSANLTGALPAIDGSALTSLTSGNLTGALPAISGAALTGIAAGGFQFISSIDISADASLEFTGFDSTKYSAYKFVFSNIVPTTDSSSTQVRLSSNGGTSYYQGTGDYRFIRLSSTGSSTTVATNSLSSFGLGSFTSGAAALESGDSGELTLYAPHLSTMKTMMLVRSTTTGNDGEIKSSVNSIRHQVNVAVNAIQFFSSGTTMATGTITMYGMVNS